MNKNITKNWHKNYLKKKRLFMRPIAKELDLGHEFREVFSTKIRLWRRIRGNQKEYAKHRECCVERPMIREIMAYSSYWKKIRPMCLNGRERMGEGGSEARNQGREWCWWLVGHNKNFALRAKEVSHPKIQKVIRATCFWKRSLQLHGDQLGGNSMVQVRTKLVRINRERSRWVWEVFSNYMGNTNWWWISLVVRKGEVSKMNLTFLVYLVEWRYHSLKQGTLGYKA
jgi:hypothetical protein